MVSWLTLSVDYWLGDEIPLFLRTSFSRSCWGIFHLGKIQQKLSSSDSYLTCDESKITLSCFKATSLVCCDHQVSLIYHISLFIAILCSAQEILFAGQNLTCFIVTNDIILMYWDLFMFSQQGKYWRYSHPHSKASGGCLVLNLNNFQLKSVLVSLEVICFTCDLELVTDTINQCHSSIFGSVFYVPLETRGHQRLVCGPVIPEIYCHCIGWSTLSVCVLKALIWPC